MMVKEIAKFWKPPIALNSSCAYPNRCSCRSSSEILNSDAGSLVLTPNLPRVSLGLRPEHLPDEVRIPSSRPRLCQGEPRRGDRRHRVRIPESPRRQHWC